ncbi:MAG: hypothetical protein HN922_11770 [Anaerolineae bacterium]|nr:hypothetical protein [Anaerolineae bacterium]
MFKNIRKYGWWVATLTMYVVVLVAFASPLPGWIWFLGGLAFMAFWVKAEAVSDKNAAKEISAAKKSQETGDSIALGEYAYPTNAHLLPWDDYHSKDEERLREAVRREREEALTED